MKKLLTLILAVALILPAAAMAEDRDPIVGCWYMFFDGDMYPEAKFAFGDCDNEISVYYFKQDGTIMMLDNTVTGGTGNPIYTLCGRWEIRNGEYYISIISLGEGKTILDGDVLKIPAFSVDNIFVIIHRIIPFNPYADYAR